MPTRPTRPALTLLTSVALAAAALGCGCSGQTTSSPMASCPGQPDLSAPSPACNTVTNNATAIPSTAATGTPPTLRGGSILDGLYEATKTEVYGGAAATGLRAASRPTSAVTRDDAIVDMLRV
jgi:hypothetical protein